MASSPQRRAANYRVSSEAIGAAQVLFGALELIAETPCSQTTERDLRDARQGARECLAELGLSPDDLLETVCPAPALLNPPSCGVTYPRDQGEVVPLRAHRSGPRR